MKIIFIYLMFFLPSEYLCTPSVEENIIQLPFSTVTSLPKNKFFDKLTGCSYLQPVNFNHHLLPAFLLREEFQLLFRQYGARQLKAR